MATVKAIVRTTRKNAEVNIRFRLSDGRNIQLFHNSEIKVNVELWDAKNDCIKKRALCADETRNSINKAVSDRKNLIISIYDANKDKKLTSEILEKLIDENLYPEKHKAVSRGFFPMLDAYINKRSISEGRQKNIKEMKRSILRYEMFIQNTENKSFHFNFDILDKDRIDDLCSFLKNESSLYKDYPSIYAKIRAAYPFNQGNVKDKGNSTIFHLFSCLRAFCNWCVKNKVINENPFLDYTDMPTPKYCTPYYITIEERNKIADFDFSQYPLLEKQRDVFLFQCLIGCRVADLMKMTANNIINGAIEYIPHKTKDGHPIVVRVPLNERAKKIIDKYKDIDCKGKILPFKALWLYNRDIKKIFELCGINRLVTVINHTTGEEEKKPINEVASSHMARRCFVGNLYKKVKDPNLIGALSGHVEGSKAFARYREIDEEMKKEVVSLIE
mgnify:CR=1 FL=1|jgi:integrase